MTEDHENWFESYRERHPGPKADIFSPLAPFTAWSLDQEDQRAKEQIADLKKGRDASKDHE